MIFSQNAQGLLKLPRNMAGLEVGFGLVQAGPLGWVQTTPQHFRAPSHHIRSSFSPHHHCPQCTRISSQNCPKLSPALPQKVPDCPPKPLQNLYKTLFCLNLFIVVFEFCRGQWQRFCRGFVEVFFLKENDLYKPPVIVVLSKKGFCRGFVEVFVEVL